MKDKKDILFLCQFFYPEYVSSATLPYDTAVALAEAGFSVGALCGYPKEYSVGKNVPRKEVHKNIDIKRLKYIQLQRSNFIGRIINYFSFTLSVALNIAHLRKYKAVLVYSNPPVLPIIAALASKLFKTKIIFVCYDMYPEIALSTNSISETGMITRMMKFANKMIFKRVERVIALSSEMKWTLLKNRPCLSSDQVSIIPNWFEDKAIKNEKLVSSNSIFSDFKNDGDIVVSYFGNMGICQDMDTILNSIRELKGNNKVKFYLQVMAIRWANLKR